MFHYLIFLSSWFISPGFHEDELVCVRCAPDVGPVHAVSGAGHVTSGSGHVTSGAGVLVDFTRVVCREVVIECVPSSADSNHHVTSLQQLQAQPNIITLPQKCFIFFSSFKKAFVLCTKEWN